MFSDVDRTALLARLIETARTDAAVVAAAVVGSLAAGQGDRWSDVDLALRLAPGVDPADAARAWTDHVRSLAEVSDLLDVRSGPALYRVFLLASSLQVDVSFWPYDAFASTGEPFDLVFGAVAGPPVAAAAPAVEEHVGWAWLSALHARSAIARSRVWQALQMVDDLRGELIALACLRHGLPAAQGRGVDRLPAAERAALLSAVPTSVDAAALTRAFRAALDLLRSEAQAADPGLAARLLPALQQLRDSATLTAADRG